MNRRLFLKSMPAGVYAFAHLPKLPVHEILGGMVRNYCECYNTAGIIPGIKPGMSVKDRAAATMAAGYRAFRMGAADTPANTTFNTRQKLNQLYEECEQAREGV